MTVALPPGITGVNQTKMPKMIKSSIGVPVGEGRKVINPDPSDQAWKARAEKVRLDKSGRPPIYTLEELEHACAEYFQWSDDNPLYEESVTFSHKTCQYFSHQVPRRRPYTQGSLAIYLGITRRTWTNWADDDKFKELVAEVNQTIREQKFAGAAAGFFNANIIARDLGLVDKQEVETKPTGSTEKITSKMTPEEAAEMYAKTRDG